jgi:hypothetical protein
MTDLLDFELEKQCIDIFYSENFLVFLNTCRQYHNLVMQKKNLVIPAKEKKYGNSCKTSLIVLV